MIKYFLKDNHQEVKIGDKIHICVPVKTPYGNARSEFDVIITQSSLPQLIKDSLVYSCDIPDINMYRPYIKRLARRLDCKYVDALKIMDLIKDTSLYAHNALLLDLMAESLNDGKKIDNNVKAINLHGDVCNCERKGIVTPFFTCNEDAMKAYQLLKPFNDIIIEEQED